MIEIHRKRIALDEDGMTFVELMICVAILSVVLMSMIYGLVLNLRLQQDARIQDIAMTDLEAAKAKILSIPFEVTRDMVPDGTVIPGLNTGIRGESITVNYLTPAGEDPMKVKITIQWQNSRKTTITRSVEFLKKK